VTATVALLAARAPKLRQAVRGAAKAGYPFAVLGGTLIRTDRVAADRPFFSGKHHCHGMNVQVISGPAGQLLWVSGALPGSGIKRAPSAVLLCIAAREQTSGSAALGSPSLVVRVGSTGRAYGIGWSGGATK
jgi:DDE superfamily endonuclease